MCCSAQCRLPVSFLSGLSLLLWRRQTKHNDLRLSEFEKHSPFVLTSLFIFCVSRLIRFVVLFSGHVAAMPLHYIEFVGFLHILMTPISALYMPFILIKDSLSEVLAHVNSYFLVKDAACASKDPFIGRGASQLVRYRVG